MHISVSPILVSTLWWFVMFWAAIMFLICFSFHMEFIVTATQTKSHSTLLRLPSMKNGSCRQHWSHFIQQITSLVIYSVEQMGLFSTSRQKVRCRNSLASIKRAIGPLSLQSNVPSHAVWLRILINKWKKKTQSCPGPDFFFGAWPTFPAGSRYCWTE